jgi:hypothetical protein
METAEMRVAGKARSSAAATIGKGECAQAGKVLGTGSRHGNLQKRRI